MSDNQSNSQSPQSNANHKWLKKLPLLAVPALGLMLFTACNNQRAVTPQPAGKPTVTIVKPQPPVVVQKPVIKNPVTKRPIIQPAPQNYLSFDQWKADFTQRAIARGYSADMVSRLMAGASLNSNVISSDKNQAEFVKMPWEYADSAVSGGRVSRGQSKVAEQRSLLSGLEARYGVDAEIIGAIWGMESSFGAVTGSSYLPSSLGSLAFEGRRRDFAEEQLTALMTLVNRGDVAWHQLDGSWAGGMGHTQFIPKTWLDYGVDGDYDGRRSPWSTSDALSSTANYLASSGWVRGIDPFVEVRLPASFNYNYVDSKQSGSAWQSMGVQPLGGYLNAGTAYELWLPAGKDGPALLLSPNFDAIKVYNNSNNYALGVSLLARALEGRGGLQTSWPRFEQPLSGYQVKNLQQRLTDMGYDPKGVDGVVGTNTRKAFARWQSDNGQIPDGFISQRSASGLIY